MQPEKKEPASRPSGEWAQIKQGAAFWLPACLALTAILLIFSILLTYVLATDAQRKRDLRTIEEQKKVEQAEKEAEAAKPANLAVLETILRDRALYGDTVESEDFLQAVFELYKEKSGDRYAAYYTEEEYRIRISQLSGQTVGIGVTLDYDTVLYESVQTQALLIKSVGSNSPAEESGLCAGEWILAVGNDEQTLQSIADLGGYEAAILAVRGEEGTEVTLRVLSEGGSARTVVCRRQAVKTNSVTGHCLEDHPDVAVIRIREFTFQTPAQFRKAVEECRRQGATQFVLDVRDNPGGSLIALRAILSGFLQNGDTVYSEKRADGSLQPVVCAPCAYTDDKEGCSVTEEQIGQYRNAGLSFAVLCNGNTVSAAELFAATMAESGIATVYGQKTAGKWIAQSTVEIPFKDFKGYVSYTVYQCFTAGGQTYQTVGFSPDTEVDLAPEDRETEVDLLQWAQDLQLQAAVGSFAANP